MAEARGELLLLLLHSCRFGGGGRLGGAEGRGGATLFGWPLAPSDSPAIRPTLFEEPERCIAADETDGESVRGVLPDGRSSDSSPAESCSESTLSASIPMPRPRMSTSASSSLCSASARREGTAEEAVFAELLYCVRSVSRYRLRCTRSQSITRRSRRVHRSGLKRATNRDSVRVSQSSLASDTSNGLSDKHVCKQ